MKGSNSVLKEHLSTYWMIYQCDFFTHNYVPAHESKLMTKFLNNITFLFLSGQVIHQTSSQLKISRMLYKTRFKGREQAIPM